METYNSVMEGHGTQNCGLNYNRMRLSVVSRVVLLYKLSVNNRQLPTGSVGFKLNLIWIRFNPVKEMNIVTISS